MISPIKKFADLTAWQEAHKVVLATYILVKKFPKDELFGLISQMRRSSVSVTSNISEGFGRFTPKDKVRFYYQARGSLTELKNQLLIAKDIGYISESEHGIIDDQIDVAHRVLDGLIRKTKSFVFVQSPISHIPSQ